MKKVNIEARLKRNKLVELAGSNFVDHNSDLLQHLNQSGKHSLIGIERADGVYTVIGETSIFFSNEKNGSFEISHQEFLNTLKNNSFEKGKNFNYEFIELNDDTSIWIKDGPTMTAIWNTVLLLSS